MMQTRHYLHCDSQFPGQDLSGGGPGFQQHWMMMAKATMFSSCVLMLPSVLTQCFCLDSKDKGARLGCFMFPRLIPPKAVSGSWWCLVLAGVSVRLCLQVRLEEQPASHSLAPQRMAALWFWGGVVSVGRSPPRSFSGQVPVRTKHSTRQARGKETKKLISTGWPEP